MKNKIVTSHAGPWLIRAAEASALEARVRDMDLAAHADAGVSLTQPATVTRVGRVAVVDIVGTLTKYGSSMVEGPAMTQIRATLRAIGKTRSASRVVLAFDSPGGTHSGIGELAHEIRALRATGVDVVAYVSDMCASAAYWLASQCRTITANDTAFVGSIGSLQWVWDTSDEAKQAGRTVRVFRSAPGKGFVDGEPVNDELAAQLQREVDTAAAQLVAAVNSGRKRDLTSLATGDVWSAAEAVANGLIDAVGTLDQLIGGLEMADAPSSGVCRINGEDMDGMTEAQCAENGGEWVPSGPSESAPAPEAAKPTAEKAATIAELNALPGADPAFVVSAVSRRLTLVQAASELCGALAAQGKSAKAEARPSAGSFMDRARARAKERGETVAAAMAALCASDPAAYAAHINALPGAKWVPARKE